MTGQQIIDHFQFLVDDDNIGEERELVLLNMALDRIYAMRPWNFLYKEDTTHTIATGTTTYALPSDFLFLPDEDSIKIIDSDGNYSALSIVPFKRRKKYKDVSGIVYLDVGGGNSNLIFSASDVSAYSGNELNITYQYQPAELTTATSPVFNRAFHSIPAYVMAKNFWYNDQVEKPRAWNREMDAEFKEYLSEMIEWDNNLSHAISPSLDPKPWVNLEDGIGYNINHDGYHY